MEDCVAKSRVTAGLWALDSRPPLRITWGNLFGISWASTVSQGRRILILHYGTGGVTDIGLNIGMDGLSLGRECSMAYG